MAEKWGVFIRENPGLPGNCNWYEVYYRGAFPDNKKRSCRREYLAEILDKHFVLNETNELVFAGENRINVLGVAHDKAEAEKRLYERARYYAEGLIRISYVGSPLVDETSRAKENPLVTA